MSATTLIEFDDVTEHTFDSTKLTLLDDKGQLKSQVSANEILFSNFDGTGLDPLISKRGNKTLVFGGVANTGQISGGVLDFPNQDRSIASYQNITDIVDDFAFRAKLISNISTTVFERNAVRLISNVDSSQIRFFISNQGGGVSRMNREIINSSGATVSNLVLATKTMSPGTTWNIAFSNDDDGNTLTFVDGVLLSTVASPPFDFTDCELRFGDNQGANNTAWCDYDNVQLFDAHEITANYAFPFPEPTTYVLTEQTLLTQIPFLLDEVLDFSIINEILADTQLKHYLLINLNPFYHDGSNWVESNGTLAQSNTPAEILANISTLPIVKGVGAYLQVASIFKSDLGYDTAVIESISLKYKFAFKPSDLSLTLVYGTIVDNSGMPVEGATVRVNSDDKFFDNAFVGPTAKAVTNSQGKFSLTVVETETSGTTVDFTVEYKQQVFANGVEFTENVVFEYNNRVIPNFPTAEFSSLVTP